MNAFLGVRSFSLSPSRGTGISCGQEGVFVGDVPLLTMAGVDGAWSVRPAPALNDELSACFQLPVDVTGKLGALALIATAFNRGDLAMAAIVTVQMQFPNPPSDRRVVEADADVLRRAVELWHSGLLKADWDPTKHPRTGTKPNPGWFALKPKPASVPSVKPRTGWPQPHVNQAAREKLLKAIELFGRTGRWVFYTLPIIDGIMAFIQAYSPTELNGGEDRLTAQLKAALQPPKTLEELHQEPTENTLGYEQHHIVNQNDDNVRKDIFEKFGTDAINDSDNVVWVPRLLHECISAQYSRNSNGEGSPLVRDVINAMDFDHQRAAGLEILRKCGVLQ
jgi:hypothetical protein